MGFKLSQMSSSLLCCCPIFSDLDPSRNTLGSGPKNLLNLGSVPPLYSSSFWALLQVSSLLNAQESTSVPPSHWSGSCFCWPRDDALATAGLRFWDLCNTITLPSSSGTGALSPEN